MGLTGLGSGYYHAWPNDATLFWDRLPMAIVFTALLATTIGERISSRGGRLLLLPLLATGGASVLYWRVADDLRLYALVQFCAVVGLPLMLVLFRPRYSGTGGIVAMIGLYAVALVLDRFDQEVAAITPTGGHPWKHAAAALAMFCYLRTIAGRRPVSQFDSRSHAGRGDRGSPADLGIRPSVPSMGRILLDERSQPEPMTATVANCKA